MRGDGSRMTVDAFLTRAEHLARTTHIAEVADMGPDATAEIVERYAALFGGPDTNTVARRALP